MSSNGEPVAKWLSRVSERSQKVYANDLKHFMFWLNQQKGWENATPESLIVKQKSAIGNGQYEILDKLQEYVTQLDLRFKSKQKRFTAVQSFFMHNRAALPKDKGFKIRSNIAPTKGSLSVEEVEHLIKSAGLRDRSIYLVKWQGLMDTDGLIYVNKKLAEYVGAEIRKGTCPIKLQMTGRKGARNITPFHTFIGKDAIDSLKRYLEEERDGGYPKTGEPLWYSNKHYANGKPRPYEYWSVQTNMLKLSRKLGIVPRKMGDASSRYGKSPHEFRDVARTYLHVKGKGDGLDSQSIEYFMGHGSKLDQLGYDRFYEDDTYMLKQYSIMEKYLNILSAPPNPQDGKIEALREEMDAKIRVIRSTVVAEAKEHPESGRFNRTLKLIDAILGGEELEITKADIKELQRLASKVRELNAIANSGEELTMRYELEAYATEELAKELIMKFHRALNEPPKDSEVPKLNFMKIVHPPKRAPKKSM